MLRCCGLWMRLVFTNHIHWYTSHSTGGFSYVMFFIRKMRAIDACYGWVLRMCAMDGFPTIVGTRADGSSGGKQSMPPIVTRNTKSVTSVLPAFWGKAKLKVPLTDEQAKECISPNPEIEPETPCPGRTCNHSANEAVLRINITTMQARGPRADSAFTAFRIVYKAQSRARPVSVPFTCAITMIRRFKD
uniref:SFRICE_022624 n=1 Tax=Spodoptera frugiperda TaxID=7108 RepID=A0A2H1V3A0_SPOFR